MSERPKARKGRAELEKYNRGERIVERQQIAAKCYQCSSGYETGLGCTVIDCPLLPENPYNKVGITAKPSGGKGEPISKAAHLHWATGLPKKMGRLEYIKHLEGQERLTRRQRIAATCIRCTAGYCTGDGCEDRSCPLYPLNPYILAQGKAARKKSATGNGGETDPA
jgi:hypothetical protein